MDVPELLLRTRVFEEYEDKSAQISIDDLQKYLEKWDAVWWNAYALQYGIMVKPFPFEARNGFFVDIDLRLATHRITSTGIARRDMIPTDEKYMEIVPVEYRELWFDQLDAQRCYSVLITGIEKLRDPIEIGNFGLFQSWGKISSKDRIQRPRLIKPSYPYDQN